MKIARFLWLLALLLSACGSSPAPSATLSPEPPAPTATLVPEPLVFDGQEALRQAEAQVAFGPRPTGSEAGWATGDYILGRLQDLGWQTEEQVTTFQGVKLRNVVGRRGEGPVIIVGAHYDTRPAADKDPVDPRQWILGANDGASGVAVLLELARVLDEDLLQNQVWLAFFDAEDRGNLDGWPFSVGAAHMAENLEFMPQAVIVLDMVGDRDQQFFYENNSDPALLQALWDIAADLGYEQQFIPSYKWVVVKDRVLKRGIIDDHVPFKERGIPVVDVIDFDYEPWHTTADTLDQISAESLERIGRVVEVYLETPLSERATVGEGP